MELTLTPAWRNSASTGAGVLRFNPADPNLYHRFFCGGGRA